MIKFDNIYIKSYSTVAGPIEENGPLKKYFDKTYKDFYMKEKTYEKAERKLMRESIKLCLKKIHLNKNNVSLFIGGDLSNQIISSSYNATNLDCPYIGIYAACASSVLGLILGSVMVQNYFDNAMCSVSSHNLTAERQFRYPIEYGGPKRETTTFTTTGSASALITKEKTNIKIKEAYLGKAIDSNLKDPSNVGSIMSLSAAETLYNFFLESKTNPNDYDLILTGDLGYYGKKILKEYMKKKYKINLINYNDAGTLIYDLKSQDVYAGGSGPACLPLVTYSYLFKTKKYKKILLIGTGALYSLTTVNQKENIPVISHLINLEVL